VQRKSGKEEKTREHFLCFGRYNRSVTFSFSAAEVSCVCLGWENPIIERLLSVEDNADKNADRNLYR
jgi:hypothetical protein